VLVGRVCVQGCAQVVGATLGSTRAARRARRLAISKKKKLVKNSQKKALHPSEVVATVRQRRPTFCDLIETIVHDVVLARLGVGTSGRNTQKRANPSHDELLETTSTCGAFFPCPAS